jgi:hypothetical protein
MAVEYDPYSRDRAWELMLRVARRPGLCCCFIYIPRSDRKRARRVFRLTRAVMRDWEKEQLRISEG